MAKETDLRNMESCPPCGKQVAVVRIGLSPLRGKWPVRPKGGVEKYFPLWENVGFPTKRGCFGNNCVLSPLRGKRRVSDKKGVFYEEKPIYTPLPGYAVSRRKGGRKRLNMFLNYF